MIAYAVRVRKEILRDKLNLMFGLGFPLVVLLLLSAIQANVPVSLFELDKLTPGITVFGLSFITLFSATLISRDRSSSFLQRLYTTPMKSRDFIFGYTLPLIPISLLQCIVCYIASFALGLKLTLGVLYAIIAFVPCSIFFISLGLLFGSILNDKQVGGVCGALLTNLTAWLSGVWFDLSLVGGAFKSVAEVLPFAHAVNLERAALAQDASAFTELIWVLCYAAAATVSAVFLFLRQMKRK